jgi:hypothetical protein
MFSAREITAQLLETDPDDISPEKYVQQLAADREAEDAAGVVNARTVLTATAFYHRAITYKDGKTPVRVRKNGSVKLWKREPNKFRVPVKYGLRDYFYIDNHNAHEWSTKPLPPPATGHIETFSKPNVI